MKGIRVGTGSIRSPLGYRDDKEENLEDNSERSDDEKLVGSRTRVNED